MKLTRNAYEKLFFCPPVPPETGGILGEMNGVIVEVCHDPAPQSLKRAEYCPDVAFLNTVISCWNRAGIHFAGIFHTHLPGQTALSASDRCYINEIFRVLPDSIDKLFFPVVLPGTAMFSYRACRKKGSVVICEDKILIENKENE